MTKIIEDVSKMTNIPTKVISSILDKVLFSILDSVRENDLAGIDTTETDIGFGTLLIKHEDNAVKYKFLPSNKMSENISKVYNEKLNLLECELEKSLVEKVLKTYKELL